MKTLPTVAALVTAASMMFAPRAAPAQAADADGIAQFAEADAPARSAIADAIVNGLREGNAYARSMLIGTAEQMSDADYAFRPTPEVRTFGQLIAHVAESNYLFCAAAQGEAPPVDGVERRAVTREQILRVLAESFDYCDAVYASAGANASATVIFMGEARSPVTVLMFRNYHALLHYGNAITYMRLRGRVPPSSQPAEAP